MLMKKKMRIYELAKELNLESKVLEELLNDLGAEVTNHMSSIEPDIATMLREHFAPEEDELIEDDDSARVVKKKKRSFKEDDEKDDFSPKARGKKKEDGNKNQAPVKQVSDTKENKTIALDESVSVNEIAQKIGVSGTEVVNNLMIICIMACLSE